MKTKLLITALLVLFSINMSADELVVGNITIPQGGQETLNIQMNNETELTAFQFDISMVNKISVAKKNNGKLNFTPGNRFQEDLADFTLSMSNPEENIYRVLGYHTETCPITGNSGTIIDIMLEASSDAVVGNSYTCTISGITLTETSGQKHYLDDFTFTVTIGEPTDERIILNENDTEEPEAIDGVNVKVVRTISKGNWNTLCLPFDMSGEQCKVVFGDDVKLAEFSGYEYNPDTETIKVQFNDITSITANRPCIIKISKDNFTEFIVDNVDINPTDDLELSVGGGSMIGTYVSGTELVDWDRRHKEVIYNYIFLSDNKFYIATANTQLMKGFRAYFDFEEAQNLVNGVKFTFDVFNQTTAIDGIFSIDKVADGVYSVNGQKQDGTSLETLPKGVYIVNGKKVFKK